MADSFTRNFRKITSAVIVETRDYFLALLLPTIICVLGISFFLTLSANAQSFSCAKAGLPAEFAICNNVDLIVMDEEIARIYERQYVTNNNPATRARLVSDHNQWVYARNQCRNNMACLTKSYVARLRAIGGQQLAARN